MCCVDEKVGTALDFGIQNENVYQVFFHVEVVVEQHRI